MNKMEKIRRKENNRRNHKNNGGWGEREIMSISILRKMRQFIFVEQSKNLIKTISMG